MADDRDIRRPKTPPAGVKAQMPGPQIWDGDKTRPGADLGERLDHRTKQISQAVVGVPDRLKELEAGQASHKSELVEIKTRLEQQDEQIAEIKTAAAYTAGKIDVIAENAAEQRTERSERRRHETQRAKWRSAAKIAAPIVAFLIAVVSAYLGLK